MPDLTAEGGDYCACGDPAGPHPACYEGLEFALLDQRTSEVIGPFLDVDACFAYAAKHEIEHFTWHEFRSPSTPADPPGATS